MITPLARTTFVYWLFVTIFCCCSCKKQSPTPSDSPKVEWIDPSTLKPGPIRHEKLSDEQIRRIKALQKVFAEVDSTSLEKWTEDFQRDMNPDRELAVWEAMATAYLRYSASATLTMAQKKDLFGLLLAGSGAPSEEVLAHVKLNCLTEAEARKVLSILVEEWNKSHQQNAISNSAQPVKLYR